MKKIMFMLCLSVFALGLAHESPKKSCCADKNKKECSMKNKKECSTKDKKTCKEKMGDKKSCCTSKNAA